MNLAWMSLGALLVTVALSCATRLNAGIISIAFAWVIGVFFGGMHARQIVASFPSELFFTLAGVALLFSQATENGTLERVAAKAVAACRGRAGFVPILFFFLGAALASCGPGPIAAAGLLAPVAMSTALRLKIPPFLMALMVGNGSNAGALSPLAPTGLVAAGVMDKIGLGGHMAESWGYNLFAHSLVGFGGYLAFGGLAQLRRTDRMETGAGVVLERAHFITIAVIAALVAAIIFFKVHIGLAAFAAVVVLSVCHVADEEAAIRKMPWSVIVMVCGVSILVALLEKTSGIDLFANLITSVSTPATVVPVVAALVGLISAYSSTSGVVLPAFLPLAQKLGGDALHIAFTINVASALVDVSPLSTIGALCVAGLPQGEDSKRLFNQLLAWGLSMTLAGALICWVLFR